MAATRREVSSRPASEDEQSFNSPSRPANRRPCCRCLDEVRDTGRAWRVLRPVAASLCTSHEVCQPIAPRTNIEQCYQLTCHVEQDRDPTRPHFYAGGNE